MKKNWLKLDNAAQLFSTIASKSDTQVFRLSCELQSPIKPKLLQKALLKTHAQFPIFHYTLKRGFFWYYLEQTTLFPQVSPETQPICSPLYSHQHKALLYEVSYYRQRINLETYHVLADGTGAKLFFTTLISEYLALTQKIPRPNLDLDTSHAQIIDDSFTKHITPTSFLSSTKKIATPFAAQIAGRQYNENRLKVITGTLPLNQTLKLAKKHQATLTIFLTACLMQAISQNLSQRANQKPVVILIPVNLRTFFPSKSLRNFFSTINVSYNFSTSPGELDDIIQKITLDLKSHLNHKDLKAKISTFAAIENNLLVKFIPLFLKHFILRFSDQIATQTVTATLSNLGPITLPTQLDPVSNFTFFSGTNQLQIGVISHQNQLSISFTTPFMSSDIAKDFFRYFSTLGLPVEITTNHLPEDI